MVKKVVDSEVLYVCEECGLKYWDLLWAKKCEAWCRKYKSCNLEITRHSVSFK